MNTPLLYLWILVLSGGLIANATENNDVSTLPLLVLN